MESLKIAHPVPTMKMHCLGPTCYELFSLLDFLLFRSCFFFIQSHVSSTSSHLFSADSTRTLIGLMSQNAIQVFISIAISHTLHAAVFDSICTASGSSPIRLRMVLVVSFGYLNQLPSKSSRRPVSRHPVDPSKAGWAYLICSSANSSTRLQC